MLFLILIFQMILPTSQVMAQETTTGVEADAHTACSITPDNINELKAYILCQSSPALAACAGLATKMGGRYEIRAPLNLSYPAMTEENIDTLSEELASQIYAGEEQNDGKTHTAFKQMSPALQAVYYQQARRIIIKILQKSTLGQVDDYVISLFVKQGVQFSKKYTGKVLTKKVASHPATLYLKTIFTKQSKMVTTRIPNLSSAKATITGGEILVARQASGALGSVILARVLSAATLTLGVAADIIFSTSPTACDMPGDEYRNLDDRCAAVLDVNNRVFDFLNLSAQEQTRLLNYPYNNVCTYYEALHEKLFEQPRFVGLSCTSQGFDLKIVGKNHKVKTLKARYRSYTKEIKQINMGHPNPLEIEKDGSIRSMNSTSIAEEAIPLKLYIMDAFDCCNASSEATQIACLAAYNTH